MEFQLFIQKILVTVEQIFKKRVIDKMEKYLNQKGRIFNIQHYSIHDGPVLGLQYF